MKFAYKNSLGKLQKLYTAEITGGEVRLVYAYFMALNYFFFSSAQFGICSWEWILSVLAYMENSKLEEYFNLSSFFPCFMQVLVFS